LTEPREPKAVSVDTASADILQARRDARAADLQKAEGQKRVAAIALERTKELVAKNAVPQSQCQKCEAELEIAEAQVTGKKAELAEADILLNRAKQAVTPSTKPVEPSGFSSTLSELRDAAELIEIQLQVKQAEHRGAKSQGDREVKEVEFREYQLRLKQAKRRVEFEEARLKREIDRVRDRLDWSEKMHKQGYVSRATYLADRKSYDELMFQLDPKYVAPKPEPEPQADAARPAAEIDAQAELAVKLIGEAKRFTGQNISYKIQVSNTGRMPATDVRVGVTLPKEGGKLIALPSSSKFDVQNRKLRWFIPRVEPGQTIDLAFAYGTSTPGSYRASVQVSSDQAPLAEDRLLTEVQAIAALDLNVTQQSRIVDVGKHNIYDITIKNVGSKPVNRVQVNGKLTKNLKLIKAFNIDKGELKFNPELGEFVFPEIEVLPVGKTITLNLEVEPLESGPAGCHVFLGHAEMLPGEPMTEDTVSTTVTKKAEDDPKK
jgi:multidrug resistance efflux pump